MHGQDDGKHPFQRRGAALKRGNLFVILPSANPRDGQCALSFPLKKSSLRSAKGLWATHRPPPIVIFPVLFETDGKLEAEKKTCMHVEPTNKKTYPGQNKTGGINSSCKGQFSPTSCHHKTRDLENKRNNS